MFFKIDILKSTNFTIFTGKYLCWSLFFDKVAGLSLSNFFKKRLQRRCFSLNIAKLLTGFFIEYLQWLLSEITSYPSHESRSNLILNISTSMFPFRNSRPEAFCKKVVKKFCKIYRKTPVPESLLQQSCRAEGCKFINKETLAQVFSCKFCEISKNTFSHRTPPAAVSFLCRPLSKQIKNV